MYDAGPGLRYGPCHQEDRYGGLGEASLYDPRDDGIDFETTAAAFERVCAARTESEGPRSPSVPEPRRLRVV